MKQVDPDSVYRAGTGESEPTFFFYDLETSGLNSRSDRIMQFAGQRTDLCFRPLGEPVNILVKMADDTLPSPGAIAVTGITPQMTQMDGLTEAEFCEYITKEIFTPGTIEVGYNSLRFDDEFMRYTLWRSFHDPYEWQWKDGRSKWDLLDVVRMTRALRPEGIEWPTTKNDRGETVPSNKLELLSKKNKIKHTHAHDALSDVEALISVTKLIHDRQPELFGYLFKMRDKNEVKKLVNLDRKVPFVYTSGRYPGVTGHTTVAFPFAAGRNGNVLVFDLRYNLEELLEQEKNFVPEEKVGRRGEKYMTRWNWEPMVKELAFNRCPAVAPLGVLESESKSDSTDKIHPWKKGTSGWEKLEISREKIEENLKILLNHPEFAERMRTLYEKMPEYPKAFDADAKLYDGFLSDKDRKACAEVRGRGANELADFCPEFEDTRLPELLLHYKARNFRSSLTESEQGEWEKYRVARLTRMEPKFVTEIEYLQKNGKIDSALAEDLLLWYQSLGSVV